MVIRKTRLQAVLPGTEIYCDLVPQLACDLFLNFVGVKSIQSLSILFYVNYPLTQILLNLDMPCLCKQCRARSVGF